MSGAPAEGLRLHRLLVLSVADEQTADGLFQWPQTRALIAERLGATAFAVEETKVAALEDVLRPLGIRIASPG